jgi:hypothetical protein
VSLPGSTPPASACSRPALTTDDLPLPDGPTTPSSGAPTRRATLGDKLLAAEEVVGVVGVECRQALVRAHDRCLGAVTVGRQQAGTLVRRPQLDDVSGQAQERYYSTYGEAEPIAAPVAPAPGNGTPWLMIAFAATVALVAASIAVIIRRRLRLRRRVARATT